MIATLKPEEASTPALKEYEEKTIGELRSDLVETQSALDRLQLYRKHSRNPVG